MRREGWGGGSGGRGNGGIEGVKAERARGGCDAEDGRILVGGCEVEVEDCGGCREGLNNVSRRSQPIADDGQLKKQRSS